MEKRVLDRRLEQMSAEGTAFRPGVNVGVDITAEQLLADFDAVVLAGGATDWRDCPCPAASWTGSTKRWSSCHGVTGRHCTSCPTTCLTRTVNRRSPQRQEVIIIGGGDTGADCLGTVHRQGRGKRAPVRDHAASAGRPRRIHAWPTYPLMYRVASAHEEGGERVFSVNTQSSLAKTARNRLRVHEVAMQDGKFVRWTAPISSSRPIWCYWRWDSSVRRSGPAHRLGVTLTDRGNVARGADFDTSVPGVSLPGIWGAGNL